MQKFEQDYADLVISTLKEGETRCCRNGITKSLFAKTLTIEMNDDRTFPILQGRKMYLQGILGELAAMLRKPKNIADFQRWGCNYWNGWGDANGDLVVDYGNAWHADDQIKRLKESLKNNPYDRRMIINGWRPDRLDSLSLPCCHLLYQFYVREDGFLDMIWYQRSVDLMVGLPSDIVFAAAWLISIANEFGYMPGVITMMLGDCHVYAEHYEEANKYVNTVKLLPLDNPPQYAVRALTGKDFCEFEPSDLVFTDYPTHPKLNFELKL